MIRFSGEGDTIIDFSAGYGGRLVGALTLPRTYVGIDPSSQQIRGLRKCAKTMFRLGRSTGKAEIIKGCAEDVLPTLKQCKAQLVFSSPPYHDWEKYSLERTQSYIRYPAYDDWARLFLGTTIKQSYRILRPGGFLAINVPNVINRLPLAHDVADLAKEAGFERYCYYRFRLSKVAFLHPRGSDSSKWEQISVFRKGR